MKLLYITILLITFLILNADGNAGVGYNNVPSSSGNEMTTGYGSTPETSGNVETTGYGSVPETSGNEMTTGYDTVPSSSGNEDTTDCEYGCEETTGYPSTSGNEMTTGYPSSSGNEETTECEYGCEETTGYPSSSGNEMTTGYDTNPSSSGNEMTTDCEYGCEETTEMTTEYNTVPSSSGNEETTECEYGCEETTGYPSSSGNEMTTGYPSSSGNEETTECEYGCEETTEMTTGYPSTSGNEETTECEYGCETTEMTTGYPSSSGNEETTECEYGCEETTGYPSSSGNEETTECEYGCEETTGYPSSSGNEMTTGYPSTSGNEESTECEYGCEETTGYPSSSGNEMTTGYPSSSGNAETTECEYGCDTAPSSSGNEMTTGYGSVPSSSGNEETTECEYGCEETVPSTSGNEMTTGYGVPSSSGNQENGCVYISAGAVPIPSDTCSNNGYCVKGSVNVDLTGCSCFSGYSGDDCSDEKDNRQVCLYEGVSPTASTFDTTIGGHLNDEGLIVLDIKAPVESTIYENEENYASYTTLRFKFEDKCDYPEGVNTEWDKLFDDTCYETYEGATSVSDLVNCMGEYVNCFDGYGSQIDCLPEACTDTPCKRCYTGQVLATRGYVRTTHSGDLSSTATAENCHNFKICLPWILDVETDIQVTPIQDFEFIVVRVAFSCFNTYSSEHCSDNPDENWIVEIESVVNYPWFVKEESLNSAKLSDGQNVYDMISLDQVSGCNNPSGNCIQKYTFHIPGCTTLEEEKVFQILGLEYDCYGDCSDAHDELSNAGKLHVDAQLTIQATQDNCGLDFVIDGTDTVSLAMNSYLNDYATANAVFVEGDESIGSAYFKIIATSSIEVHSFTLIKLTSQLESNTPLELNEGSAGYHLEVCPPAATEGKPSICFNALVTSLYEDPLDQESELVNVNVHATVEILFTDGSKREVGLGNKYSLNKAINVKKGDAKAHPTSSASALAVTSAALFLAYV